MTGQITVDQPSESAHGEAAALFDEFIREHLEYLKPGEAVDYCGHPARQEPYYCIRPAHETGRHRYGVVFLSKVQVSTGELPAR